MLYTDMSLDNLCQQNQIYFAIAMKLKLATHCKIVSANLDWSNVSKEIMPNVHT